MKKFLKKYKIKTSSIPKYFGVGILAIVFLSVAVWFIGFALRSAFGGFGYGGGSFRNENIATQEAFYKGVDGDYVEDAVLSARGGGILPPYYGGSVGDDAEDFEVTEYNAGIKTGNLESTCARVEDLKKHTYVIFENSNKYDHECYYSFKVENNFAENVLGVINDLKPETFYSNTYTIKPSVDYTTNEIEILEKKLASIEETLEDALVAYDKVADLATRSKDVESLAKIIDSKVKLIERLTLERINTKERIDRYNRQKSDQLDRLNYTFFRVSVSEVVIFDGKQIKNSWVRELQNFVKEFNGVLQGISVNLLSLLLKLVQVLVYFLIALFVIKYGWRVTKRLWKI